MDDTVGAMAEQLEELDGILSTLSADGWHAPTRCEGWDIADVVLHLAQTDEMAVGSATGSYQNVLTGLTEGISGTTSVDDGVDRMVRRERGAPDGEVLARWRRSKDALVAALRAVDPSARVPWVAGDIAARTLATTRLAESWIHTGDIAGAVGIELPPSDRLRLIARLAWRTLPYAFQRAGRTLDGPVALRLTGPAGQQWDFVPDEPPATTITGPAVDLCSVAARRVEPAATALRAEGPDGAAVLELIRTYA